MLSVTRNGCGTASPAAIQKRDQRSLPFRGHSSERLIYAAYVSTGAALSGDLRLGCRGNSNENIACRIAEITLCSGHFAGLGVRGYSVSSTPRSITE